MLKRSLGKFYVANFLSNLAFFNAVFVPFLTLWGKISFFQIMLLQAVFHFGRLVFEIPTGAIGDYIGRKKTLVLSFFMQSLAAIIYASYPNFFVFVGAELLWSFSVALISGTDVAYAYDLLRNYKLQRKAKAVIANYKAISLAASLVAAITGSFIAGVFGVRFPMLFSAFPFACAGIAFLNAAEPRYKKGKNYVEILKRGLKFFFRSDKAKLYTMDIASIGVLSFSILWTWQYLLQLVDFNIKYFGFVYVAIVLVQIVPLYLLKENKLLPFIAGILSGIGFIFVATLNVYGIIIGSMLAILGIVRKTIKIAEMQHFVPSKQRATINSVTGLFSGIAFVMLNPIIGKFVESNASLFLTLIGITIIALTLFFHLIERKK